MDCHGLILWENEATGFRKVFRYLLDLRDAIFEFKIDPRHLKIPKSDFTVFLYGVGGMGGAL